MDFWRAIELGLVQGLTEFLPVSSSGHLVLAEHLLGVDPPGISFEVVLHLGTLLAVLVYFRHRLWDIGQDLVQRRTVANRHDGRKYFLALVIGTIPAGVAGILFKDQVEAAFSAPKAAAAFLLVTGVFLLATRLARGMQRPLTLPRAFLVGCAQAVALLPGISRSGSTMSAAMGLGISPAAAAEFSFILSIPAILGATVLSVGEALAEGISGPIAAVYALGGCVAALVGYASLWLLFGMIKKGRFWWFGVYCLVVGIASLVLLP